MLEVTDSRGGFSSPKSWVEHVLAAERLSLDAKGTSRVPRDLTSAHRARDAVGG